MSPKLIVANGPKRARIRATRAIITMDTNRDHTGVDCTDSAGIAA